MSIRQLRGPQCRIRGRKIEQYGVGARRRKNIPMLIAQQSGAASDDGHSA
jgi:hypothetical protein